MACRPCLSSCSGMLWRRRIGYPVWCGTPSLAASTRVRTGAFVAHVPLGTQCARSQKCVPPVPLRGWCYRPRLVPPVTCMCSEVDGSVLTLHPVHLVRPPPCTHTLPSPPPPLPYRMGGRRGRRHLCAHQECLSPACPGPPVSPLPRLFQRRGARRATSCEFYGAGPPVRRSLHPHHGLGAAVLRVYRGSQAGGGGRVGRQQEGCGRYLSGAVLLAGGLWLLSCVCVCVCASTCASRLCLVRVSVDFVKGVARHSVPSACDAPGAVHAWVWCGVVLC